MLPVAPSIRAENTVATEADSKAIFIWSGIGVLALAFIFYVLTSWVSSSTFGPTSPGPDVLPSGLASIYLVLQAIIPVIYLGALYYWLIKPWRQTGRPSIEGLFTIAWAFAFFQDPLISYFSNTLCYNAYFVNFGTWANGSFPGWVAGNSNYLAEPVVIGPFAYAIEVLGGAMLIYAVLGRITASRPHTRVWMIVVYAFLMGMVCDFVAEASFVRLQVFSYPGTVGSLSLWAGTKYQFPVYESIFFGGVFAAMALLLWFRNHRGQTMIERGSERLNAKSAIAWRLLAAIGFVQAIMFCIWVIPMQVITLIHVDRFPDLPSYLHTYLCDATSQLPCPKPKLSTSSRPTTP